MGSDFFIRHNPVLDGCMDGFQEKRFRVPPLYLDETLPDGELTECFLLFVIQKEIIGRCIDIFPRLEVERKRQICVSQGR